MEILSLMADGTSNREIAAQLRISYVTVRRHVRNLSRKLAAYGKVEAGYLNRYAKFVAH